MQVITDKLQVPVLSDIIGSDQIEAWDSQELVVELSREMVEDLTPRPLRLPLFEHGRPRGYLEGWLKGIEQDQGLPQLRFLTIEAEIEGQKVHASITWDRVVRHFELEDATHVLWRGWELDLKTWERWVGDLKQLGLEDKAEVLGEQIGPRKPMHYLEPTPENAWALWLAAWRFGDRVGLKLGMRWETLGKTFRDLQKQFPELPDTIFQRSREVAGWDREDFKRLKLGG